MERNRKARYWKIGIRSPLLLRIFFVSLLLILWGHTHVEGQDHDSSTKNSNMPKDEKMIFDGIHERIHYIGNFRSIIKSSNNDLQIQYNRPMPNNPKESTNHTIKEVPQYFTALKDAFIETEIEYRVQHGRWSDQVLLEKLYFGLVFGRSGYPNHYFVGDEDYGKDELPYSRKLELAYGWSMNVFRRTVDLCTLEGIYCYEDKILKIVLPSYELTGTLTDSIQYLTDLELINLRGNSIRGSIPSTLEKLTNLQVLILSGNSMTGTLPRKVFSRMTNLRSLWLKDNNFTGRLPKQLLSASPTISFVDVSNNTLTGSIPENFFSESRSLVDLYLEDNNLTGQLPKSISSLIRLEAFRVDSNRLTGSIPTAWMEVNMLKIFTVANNMLVGKIPSQILQLKALHTLDLANNSFTGYLPTQNAVVTPEEGWSRLSNLAYLQLSGNKFSGTIPATLFTEDSTLFELDLSHNLFSGSLPDSIGWLSHLRLLHAQCNDLTGTLPVTMTRLRPTLDLNLTSNHLQGTVPKTFCVSGGGSNTFLFRQFGCAAVMCPPGTFSPSGAATMEYGCRPCVPSDEGGKHNPPLKKVLGSSACPGTNFVYGDLNGDGELSDREILRLLWVYTDGMNWGPDYAMWGDAGTGECLLIGVKCSDKDEVIEIDLSGATLCAESGRSSQHSQACRGLPRELGQLRKLAILKLNEQKYLRTTIPSELGLLSKLQHLDLGKSPFVVGSIPDSIGRLSSLKILNLARCRLNGTIPDGLYRLTRLEKLYFSLNSLSGSISTQLGRLTNLKEFMVSRASISGRIPDEVGDLIHLENLELYGNNLTGTIPASIGNCSSLRRIDIFNNRLSGQLPESLTQLVALQILHVKSNRLTGTIHPDFGRLPFLTWFDVSTNQFHGTIAESFGSSRALRDFRVGGNMIHEPIPKSLCVNTNINGGLTRNYGCDGVLCPLGTYTEQGHAVPPEGCKPCPDGQTTIYLGASACEAITDVDILAMYYNVMFGTSPNEMQRHQWKDPEGDDWCTWKGITCDNNGEISAIRFPLLGLDDPDGY